ncbi:hypothetical protein [Thalassospira permensis]|uniref:Phage holin family protein n=1 Tax=Thalassospira permensis NBRC 106175 TaxID=1353532 RepID=A0ABR4TLT9_9PROT|nr:hypothetical protein [Thalassospira permensis]KEO53776.1 hypothetical protein SMB34_06890 [Thalassospira permensis NBRC 106175]
MIDQLVEAITEIAKAAAVKLAVFAVIGVTILIGIGFLLAAVFIYLAAQFGTLGAALGLGTVLVALGLVALAIVLQRDPSDGIARQDKAGADPARSEDALLFDMLIHAARAGYATGQGDKSQMQDGFERLFTDLSDLGAFDRPVSDPEAGEKDRETADTKMAG